MAVIESRPKIRIGVFIPTDCQLLDMACVDIFGTMSYEYLTIVKDLVPGPLMNLAPSVEISYISVVQPGELIRLTSSASVACTHHFSDPKMQPGMLDIVFVPGPDPAVDYSNLKDALDWLTAHAAHPGTDILSVCTGAYLCGAAGVFNGKKASGPRGVQGDLEKKFPDVKWVGGEFRWVKDGNIWSSGGSSELPFLLSLRLPFETFRAVEGRLLGG
ncbi:class I glutamine amidotransferase-like protein [Chaetomium sp. MPI-SDFR-AT-0129]|nr:class I glutamine amidotransferase-like protein [Chaetomium sp. MPI-SDFR-AT-0129]